MRTWKILPIVALAILTAPRYASAQSLAADLFERYLDALRQQAGIPGLSAAIVNDQRIVWEKGFGLQDVERSIAASPDTPYLIGDLTQTLSATLALQCAEEGRLPLGDAVRQALSHTDSSGVFRYDASRFASLTGLVRTCRDGYSFPQVIKDRLLSRLAMMGSVPGHDIADSPSARSPFDPAALEHYDRVLGRLAIPYRIDRAGKAIRADYPVKGLNAATGLISTVRDLASFDAALDQNLLLAPGTKAAAWTNTLSATGAAQPMGLGWFAQTYNGRRIVWHFGLLRDAFSSLMIKVPDSGLTLIVLANSDGLSSSFPLSSGDVTTSAFAQLFLRAFVP